MIQDFFANGMLMSVMSAIDLVSVNETWAQSICPNEEKLAIMKAESMGERLSVSTGSGRA